MRTNGNRLTKVEKCRECGSTSLTWFATIEVVSGVQQNRLNTRDVACRFVLGCDNCSETLVVIGADNVASWLNREQKPLSVEAIKPFLAVVDAYDLAESDHFQPHLDADENPAMGLTLGQFRALALAVR